MARLFGEMDSRLGEPGIIMYNRSARLHGPLAEIDPEAVRQTIAVSAFYAFLAVQQAARRMIPKSHGAILLNGSSAGIKGSPLPAASAMGKFALRGLAQGAARKLGPKGIHVAMSSLTAPVVVTPGRTRRTARTAC